MQKIFCVIFSLLLTDSAIATCLYTHDISSKDLYKDYGCVKGSFNKEYKANDGEQWMANPYGHSGSGIGPTFQIYCGEDECANNEAPVNCKVGKKLLVLKENSTDCFLFEVRYGFPKTPSDISISPTVGIVGQDVHITIGGANFAKDADVQIRRMSNVIRANAIVVVNPNIITCTLHLAPDTPCGTWDIIVTNQSSGQSGIEAECFKIISNSKPVVTPIDKSVVANNILNFYLEDFASHFTPGSGGNNLTEIQVPTVPGRGILKLSGIPVIPNQKIPDAQISELTYEPQICWIGDTYFTWRGSDEQLYSENTANINVNVTPDPNTPSAYNVSIIGEENTAVLFKSEMFTKGSHDPQGRSLSNIIINSLPDYGTLQLHDTTVKAGEQIHINDISNLKFVPNKDWHSQTSFGWAAYFGGACPSNVGTVNIAIFPYSFCDNHKRLCVYVPIIVSSVAGTVGIVVGCVKFKKWYKKRQTQNNEQLNNNELPDEEISNLGIQQNGPLQGTDRSYITV